MVGDKGLFLRPCEVYLHQISTQYYAVSIVGLSKQSVDVLLLSLSLSLRLTLRLQKREPSSPQRGVRCIMAIHADTGMQCSSLFVLKGMS